MRICHARSTLLAALAMASGALIGCDKSTTNAPDGGTTLPSDLLRACPGAAGLSTSKHGACTEIGCVGGFVLRVLPPSSWPQGAYRFVFGIDGHTVTCAGSLPLKSCGEASITCDGAGVHISESGCALPASAQSFSDIRFDDYPGAVSVDVLLSDVSIAHADYQPPYQVGQPNGPGCPPICCSASADLTVTFPRLGP
jgi:hypothetical protein